MKEDIKILRVKDNLVVDASLVTLTNKHIDDFETFWKSRLQSSEEEDSHWDWRAKDQALFSSDYEKYAIECEQITQGLMMLEVSNHYSKRDSGSKIVYVDFIATAPWNRPSVKESPDYKGVGSILLEFSRQRSIELGYRGRVGLHALPQAENFYKKKGMISFGLDINKESLLYFEWVIDLET